MNKTLACTHTYTHKRERNKPFKAYIKPWTL